MRFTPLAYLGLFLMLLTAGARAETTTTFALELNALQPMAQACRVSFLATNGLGERIDKAVFELAVFGTDAGIERVVSLAFSALTPGKSKVVQFALKATACDGVTRILINDITSCEGAGLAPTACLDSLKPSTRTGIAFGI